MILRSKPGTLGLFFVMRGSIIMVVAPRIIGVTLLAVLVAWAHHQHIIRLPQGGTGPFTLLGLALSIFLGFRNNACYDRWWEGRKLWGQLIIESRATLRETLALLPAEESALRRRLAHRVVAFAHLLRDQLRGEPAKAALDFLGERDWAAARSARDAGGVVLRAQSEDLAALLRQGKLSDILYRLLADHIAGLAAIQASCERLRNTPLPFTYTLLVHRTAWLFCFLLPFGLVGTLGAETPVVSAIVAYAFFGLDALGDELEEPFQRSQNALPLDAMVRAIEIAAAEALGETPPEALEPDNYILL